MAVKNFINYSFTFLLIGIVLCSSCTDRKYKILSSNKDSLDSITVAEIMQICTINEIAEDFEINYQSEKSLEDNLQMLIDKEVDFIISQNDIAFDFNSTIKREKKVFNDGEVRVVTALFTEALFIIYPDSLQPQSLANLLEGRKVSLGVGDRTAEGMMPVLLNHLKVDTTKVNFVSGDFSMKKKKKNVLKFYACLHPLGTPSYKKS